MSKTLRSWCIHTTLAGIALLQAACVDYGTADWIVIEYAVTTKTENGTISPQTAHVRHGETTAFALMPAEHYTLRQVSGCQGTLTGNIYVTGPITEACTINAIFGVSSYSIDSSVTGGGRLVPDLLQIEHGETGHFTVIPSTGYHIDSITGCDGSLSGDRYTTGSITANCTVNATFTINRYPVSTNSNTGGTVSPAESNVTHGDYTSFIITADTGYHIDSVTGCGGSLTGNRYTTAPITGECTVNAAFRLNTYTVSATAGPGGTVTPTISQVQYGDTASVILTPDTGYRIDSVTGCGGSLTGDRYVTDVITGDCLIDVSFIRNPPAVAAIPALTLSATKIFRFTWSDVGDATFYRLLEDPNGQSGFAQAGMDIAPGIQSIDHVVPLYARFNARYVLQSCNEGGCSDASPLAVDDTLAAAVGYLKAGKPDYSDWFGETIALSRDGTTLAVGARYEDSNAVGVNGDQFNNSAANSGAVYIFVRSESGWHLQAYIKASNTGTRDEFGSSVSLSDDGNTLAVGAPWEDSSATGINNNENDNAAADSGAAYIFSRNGTTWSQQAYIKASNTDPGDKFGNTLSLSGDGNTLAVSAPREDSSATGINGNENDNAVTDSGAVYLFTRSGNSWNQQAYLKADTTETNDWFGISLALNGNGNRLAAGKLSADYSGKVCIFARSNGIWTQEGSLIGDNTTNGDQFGRALSFSNDGNTLAAGAHLEDSGAAGVDGDGNDNSAFNSGAAYIFIRNGNGWNQQAYIKASNPEDSDQFGRALSLNGDGNMLIIGAPMEDSGAIGINGDSSDNTATNAGAAYVFVRDNGTWFQQAYVKAPNTAPGDRFGGAVSLALDVLAIGSPLENSNATGVNGTSNGIASDSGATYLY